MWQFLGLTMEKIKIAIIDSGLDSGFTSLFPCSVDGISIKRDHTGISIHTNHYKDENGHGTLSASVIWKECSSVELFVVKILDRNLKGDIGLLNAALEYLSHTDVKLINMSIAVDHGYSDGELTKICKKLSQQNKILISSIANGQRISYPACCYTVIGVRGIRLCDNIQFLFVPERRVNCIVNDLPYLHYKGCGTYALYGGHNSYAAARATGIIARILLQNTDLCVQEQMKIIQEQSQLHPWNLHILKRYRGYPVFRDDSVNYEQQFLAELAGYISSFFSLQQTELLYDYSLFSSKVGGRTSEFAYSLIKYLENIYGKFTDDYCSLSRNNFISIYSLYQTIRGNKDE